MYPLLKRTLDLLIALITFILISPIFIIFIPLLRLTGEGEVWYRQKRVGYKNQHFFIWKFATMLKDSPNIGTGNITLRNDPRLMPLGSFLRKTKINELPQIFNVFTGEMSIVGPRPLVDRIFNAYPEDIRYKVYEKKPGITGIGSIIFRDEEKLISESGMEPYEFYKTHIAPYKGALEMWYQRHASILTDLLLIFLTAWVIFFHHSQLPYKIFKDLPPRPAELG